MDNATISAMIVQLYKVKSRYENHNSNTYDPYISGCRYGFIDGMETAINTLKLELEILEMENEIPSFHHLTSKVNDLPEAV